MSKEKYNQVIDEAYENFVKSYTDEDGDIILPPDDYINDNGELLSKQEFINECKTNPEFSKNWGLQIEERELSLEERMGLCKEKWYYSWNRTINLEDIEWRMNNEWNIPTKLITLTYNNETIESYG